MWHKYVIGLPGVRQTCPPLQWKLNILQAHPKVDLRERTQKGLSVSALRLTPPLMRCELCGEMR